MNDSKKNYQGFNSYIKLALKGFCMGIADIIPGVSGGTIAFLFGIYEDLIKAIRSFDLTFVKLLGRLKFREAFAHAHWRFLGTILLGIMTAIFTLSKIMKWLLHNKPVLIQAFFFGLVLATVFIIGRRLKKWNFPLISLGILSTGTMYVLVGMVPLQTPESLWFLFISGALAICAMILPGISGAFILVLLGKYEYIIESVSERNLLPLICVAAGCVVGILTFVRILTWLLRRYHDQTVAILTGLVLGSLRKIWPWKETLREIVTHKGKVIPIEQINILPQQWDNEVTFAIILIVAGFAIALLLGQPAPKRFMNHE